jgi:hypothetical protein
VDIHSSAVVVAVVATEELEEEASASVERRRRVEVQDGVTAVSLLEVCLNMWVAASLTV